MPRRRTISGTIINTAVFIILEIAALDMLRNNGPLQDFFVSKAAHGFMGTVWGASESVRYYTSLRKENERLSEEVLRLTEKVNSLSGIARENDAADAMVDTGDGRFGFMPAEIRKNSINKQHNYLIINKGSEDGVTPQTGIITSAGVIGIVDAVSRHYSYAISFLNSEISISARIGDSGAAGPMQWDGKKSGGALLREIPLQYRFSPGDTVYTSGFSSIFPADIPLGTVGESRIVNGATYEVAVSLFQDFTALRYVTLVKNKDMKEITELVDNDNQGGR
ncbi:MAG: rod shape-determining protein MreC [Candidatus Cryptobacteroides sp.]